MTAKKISRAEAKRRLHDLLNSDIYTDAPEYAERVAEVVALLPLVFHKAKALPRCHRCGKAIREGSYQEDSFGQRHLNFCP